MKELTDKVAIVSGGGQGIGLGIALALAGAGANVVITGRNKDKLELAVEQIRQRGAKVITVVADVRKRESVDKVVRACIDQFGRLDILVNNAQSGAPGTSFIDHDDELISTIVESGFMGTLYFMQAAYPHLKERGGSVINLGSREGILGGKGHSLYAATKEAIRALSRTTAREWGEDNIRVNVINPAALSALAMDYFKQQPEMEKYYLDQIALRYFGDPESDIGSVVVFLASEASRYVTGQTLNVDGGQVML